MDFHSMKRKELQALCKKNNIPANLTNVEMANKLNLLSKEKEKPVTRGRSCLKNTEEIADNSTDVVARRQSKKVKFSPDHEVIVLEKNGYFGDNPVKVTRLRARKSEVGGVIPPTSPPLQQKRTRKVVGFEGIEVEFGNRGNKSPEIRVHTRKSLRIKEVTGENPMESESLGQLISIEKSPRKRKEKGINEISENKYLLVDDEIGLTEKPLRRSNRNVRKVEDSEQQNGELGNFKTVGWRRVTITQTQLAVEGSGLEKLTGTETEVKDPAERRSRNCNRRKSVIPESAKLGTIGLKGKIETRKLLVLIENEIDGKKRVTRPRAHLEVEAFGVDSEARFESDANIKGKSDVGPQFGEISNRPNVNRRKSVRFQVEEVGTNSFAKENESKKPLEGSSRVKRSKAEILKREKEASLSDVHPRRNTRRKTSNFGTTISTDEELGTQKVAMEREVSDEGNVRRSRRNDSRHVKEAISADVGKKKPRKGKRDHFVEEEIVATQCDPLIKEPPKRSTCKLQSPLAKSISMVKEQPTTNLDRSMTEIAETDPILSNNDDRVTTITEKGAEAYAICTEKVNISTGVGKEDALQDDFLSITEVFSADAERETESYVSLGIDKDDMLQDDKNGVNEPSSEHTNTATEISFAEYVVVTEKFDVLTEVDKDKSCQDYIPEVNNDEMAFQSSDRSGCLAERKPVEILNTDNDGFERISPVADCSSPVNQSHYVANLDSNMDLGKELETDGILFASKHIQSSCLTANYRVTSFSEGQNLEEGDGIEEPIHKLVVGGDFAEDDKSGGSKLSSENASEEDAELRIDDESKWSLKKSSLEKREGPTEVSLRSPDSEGVRDASVVKKERTPTLSSIKLETDSLHQATVFHVKRSLGDLHEGNAYDSASHSQIRSVESDCNSLDDLETDEDVNEVTDAIATNTSSSGDGFSPFHQLNHLEKTADVLNTREDLKTEYALLFSDRIGEDTHRSYEKQKMEDYEEFQKFEEPSTHARISKIHQTPLNEGDITAKLSENLPGSYVEPAKDDVENVVEVEVPSGESPNFVPECQASHFDDEGTHSVRSASASSTNKDEPHQGFGICGEQNIEESWTDMAREPEGVSEMERALQYRQTSCKGLEGIPSMDVDVLHVLNEPDSQVAMEEVNEGSNRNQVHVFEELMEGSVSELPNREKLGQVISEHTNADRFEEVLAPVITLKSTNIGNNRSISSLPCVTLETDEDDCGAELKILFVTPANDANLVKEGSCSSKKKMIAPSNIAIFAGNEITTSGEEIGSEDSSKNMDSAMDGSISNDSYGSKDNESDRLEPNSESTCTKVLEVPAAQRTPFVSEKRENDIYEDFEETAEGKELIAGLHSEVPATDRTCSEDIAISIPSYVPECLASEGKLSNMHMLSTSSHVHYQDTKDKGIEGDLLVTFDNLATRDEKYGVILEHGQVDSGGPAIDNDEIVMEKDMNDSTASDELTDAIGDEALVETSHGFDETTPQDEVKFSDLMVQDVENSPYLSLHGPTSADCKDGEDPQETPVHETKLGDFEKQNIAGMTDGKMNIMDKNFNAEKKEESILEDFDLQMEDEKAQKIASSSPCNDSNYDETVGVEIEYHMHQAELIVPEGKETSELVPDDHLNGTRGFIVMVQPSQEDNQVNELDVDSMRPKNVSSGSNEGFNVEDNVRAPQEDSEEPPVDNEELEKDSAAVDHGRCDHGDSVFNFESQMFSSWEMNLFLGDGADKSHVSDAEPKCLHEDLKENSTVMPDEDWLGNYEHHMEEEEVAEAVCEDEVIEEEDVSVSTMKYNDFQHTESEFNEADNSSISKSDMVGIEVANISSGGVEDIKSLVQDHNSTMVHQSSPSIESPVDKGFATEHAQMQQPSSESVQRTSKPIFIVKVAEVELANHEHYMEENVAEPKEVMTTIEHNDFQNTENELIGVQNYSFSTNDMIWTEAANSGDCEQVEPKKGGEAENLVADYISNAGVEDNKCLVQDQKSEEVREAIEFGIADFEANSGRVYQSCSSVDRGSANEDVQMKQSNSESVQRQSLFTEVKAKVPSMKELNSNTTARKNLRPSLVQGTPKKLITMPDMKENAQSTKRENLGTVKSVKTVSKRRALEDLHMK